MPVTVTDDRVAWDAMLRRMRDLDDAAVLSGLHDEDEARKGIFAEKGTRNHEARPWLSVAADTGQNKIFGAGAAAVKRVADGADGETELRKVGAVVVQLATDVIVNNRVGGPDLEPSTSRAKHSTKKLVETGDMIVSLSTEVDI